MVFSPGGRLLPAVFFSLSHRFYLFFCPFQEVFVVTRPHVPALGNGDVRERTTYLKRALVTHEKLLVATKQVQRSGVPGDRREESPVLWVWRPAWFSWYLFVG